MLYTPYPYQLTAISHILRNQAVLDATGAGNFMGLGLGKSSVTATAAQVLIHDWKVYDKMLIIAPKLVTEQSWPAEFKKWDHLANMTVSVVAGDTKKRIRALKTPANVYCISCDNIAWLVGLFKGFWPFKFVVVDEIHKFKSPDSNRFKALRTVRPQIDRLIGLTGTPASNGLIDLWAQLYLIDKGERLGKYVTHYRKEHFTSKTTQDNVEYDFKIRKERDPLLGKDIHAALIADKIRDICLSMKPSDYLDLPPLIDIFKDIELGTELMERYHTFAKESVMEVAEEEITAFSAAALYNKLLQFANGAVYDVNKTAHGIHDAKLNMLEEIMDEAAGAPVLVFYNFQSDVERIKQRLGRYRPQKFDGPESINRWNRGEIKLGLMHASAAAGLNLQQGGHNMVWFGLPWSLDSYQQACARLHRQGQQERVNNFVLLCPGTLEYKVAQRLRDKELTQNDLLDAIKAEVFKLKST